MPLPAIFEIKIRVRNNNAFTQSIKEIDNATIISWFSQKLLNFTLNFTAHLMLLPTSVIEDILEKIRQPFLPNQLELICEQFIRGDFINKIGIQFVPKRVNQQRK